MGDENSEHVLAEFHELVAAQQARARLETGYQGIFKSRGMRKRLLYGLYATSLQQAGGIAALTMYAALIYKSLGCESCCLYYYLVAETDKPQGTREVRLYPSTASKQRCS